MTSDDILKKLAILYVEDEDIARLSTGIFLRKYVGELLLGSNGGEGLALYHEKQPAVVITDLEMPVMSGMEMIRRIRALDQQIPIIVTTAYDDKAHQCPDVDRVILKPVLFANLLQAVQDCLAERA